MASMNITLGTIWYSFIDVIEVGKEVLSVN